MNYENATHSSNWAASRVFPTLVAFPVATFSLTVLTDMAYWATSNLLWLHFSEWLLLAGLVFGVIAALWLAVTAVARRFRSHWLYVLFSFVALVIAAINSFVHTADGWTAVVPYGLTLSIATVIAMLLASWFGSWRHSHD